MPVPSSGYQSFNQSIFFRSHTSQCIEPSKQKRLPLTTVPELGMRRASMFFLIHQILQSKQIKKALLHGTILHQTAWYGSTRAGNMWFLLFLNVFTVVILLTLEIISILELWAYPKLELIYTRFTNLPLAILAFKNMPLQISIDPDLLSTWKYGCSIPAPSYWCLWWWLEQFLVRRNWHVDKHARLCHQSVSSSAVLCIHQTRMCLLATLLISKKS